MELEMKKVIFLSTAIVFSFLESATPYDGMGDFSSLGYRRAPRAQALLAPSEEPAPSKVVPSGIPHASTTLKSFKKRRMGRFQPRQHGMDTPMHGRLSKR
jgi:hypothetical protein